VAKKTRHAAAQKRFKPDLTNHLLKEACQLFQKLSRSWQLFIHLGIFSGVSTPPTCNEVLSFKTYQEYMKQMLRSEQSCVHTDAIY